MALMSSLRNFAKHPITQGLVGLGMLVTGLDDSIEALETGFELGSHHGVALLGACNVLGNIPDVVEGFRKVRPNIE